MRNKTLNENLIYLKIDRERERERLEIFPIQSNLTYYSAESDQISHLKMILPNHDMERYILYICKNI